MKQRYNKDQAWQDRHVIKSDKPPMVFSPVKCEICGGSRNVGSHDKCSKKKQRMAQEQKLRKGGRLYGL